MVEEQTTAAGKVGILLTQTTTNVMDSDETPAIEEFDHNQSALNFSLRLSDGEEDTADC